jgi:hypothetical protein
MPSSFEENTDVITLDGKKIGKVKKIENDGYFIVYRKGLLTDEEFRIPLSAVLTRGNISAKHEPIRLNMSEQTLKHGYQFVQAGPNSQFMHGIKESEPKVKLEKQVMHFEPVEPVEGPNKTGISSPPVSKQHQAVLKQGEESSTLYSCDMCPAKFNKAEDLQKHRSESHKAAFNI